MHAVKFWKHLCYHSTSSSSKQHNIFRQQDGCSDHSTVLVLEFLDKKIAERRISRFSQIYYNNQTHDRKVSKEKIQDAIIELNETHTIHKVNDIIRK